MGLTKNQESTKVYLSVSEGSLVRQYREPNEKTKTRVTKTGKTVHEERFKDLSATLVAIESRENDFGKQLCLHFRDGIDVYQVNMPYSSRYSASFLKALPNIDTQMRFRFMPWSMADKNDPQKSVTGITCYQNNTKILPAFTKDNPGEMPQMVKIKVKGKEAWDDSDMMEFLENNALAILAKNKPATPEVEPASDITDLPF